MKGDAMKYGRLHQSGFTLIEMLIAMAMGMIVIGAAIGVFNNSQSSYNIQEDIAATQQDLRVAKSFIERDVRMAGAGFTDYPRLSDIAPATFLGLDFGNGTGPGGSDMLTVRYAVPISDPCGVPPAGEVSCSELPNMTLRDDNTGSTGPFPITAFELSVNETLTSTDPNFNLWSASCYCRGAQQNGTSGMPIMAVVIDPNSLRADKIAVTSVDPSTGTFSSTPLNSSSAETYPAGSTIRFFMDSPIEQVEYYLQDGVLMRRKSTDIVNGGTVNTDPVAEHIEDLQFAFGLDTDDDNVVDQWIDGAGGVGLTADDLTDANKALVRAVRINVLGRTAQPRRELAKNSRPALEDHAAADTEDFYRRRLSQVTVEFRNMGLQSPVSGGGS